MNKAIFTGISAIILFSSACGVSPGQYIERGNKLFDSGKYADAEINYRKAIQKDSKLGEAYYRLGTVQLRESRPENAYQTLVSAAGLLPGRHDVAAALADAAFAAYLRNPRASAYYDQVVSAASRFLKEDPKSFDGLRLKGYVATFDKHYPDAIQFLKAANDVKPMQNDVVLALVQCLIQSQQGPEAVKLGQSLIQKDKTFSPIYDVLYRYYAGENRAPEAEAVLKTRVANNPDNAGYRLELASHYAGAGDEAALKQTIQQLRDSGKFPDADLQIGDFYSALNRMDDAVKAFEAGEGSQPGSKLVYQKRIAKILIFQGKKDQATELVGEMLKEHRDDYEAQMMRASIEVDSGDPAKLNSGTEELAALAKEKPSDAIVRLNLGKARLRTGDTHGALAQFKEALKIEPQLVQARLLAAETSIQTQDYQQALQYADEILQAGDNPVARLIKVRSLAGLGNVSQATADVNRLAQDFPAESAPKLELASLEMGRKNFAGAESMFRSLHAADPKNPAALQGLIQAQFAQNKYDAAIETLKQERLRNDSPEVRALLAGAFLRGQKLNLAIQAYTELVAANPNLSFFHMKLGDALIQDGRIPDAIAEFQTAQKLAPKDPMANAMLALGLQKSGRNNEAILAYRSALALDSANSVLMNNLAYLIAETGGDLNDALQLAQRASHLHPADADLSDTEGWIYLKKNMTNDAVHVLSDIVLREPAQPVYRYHLALAFLQKGNKPEARKQLEAALANQPTKADEAKINDLLASNR